MVVPSLTGASIAGATSSWVFSEMPWSCRTSPTVSPVAVTWSIFPSTLRVTSLPIEAYPTVVPTTAAAATAAAPTRAILLLLTCASFWRTALQTSYSPGLGCASLLASSPWGVVAAATHVVMQKAACRSHGSQPPAPVRLVPDPGQQSQDHTEVLQRLPKLRRCL